MISLSYSRPSVQVPPPLAIAALAYIERHPVLPYSSFSCRCRSCGGWFSIVDFPVYPRSRVCCFCSATDKLPSVLGVYAVFSALRLFSRFLRGADSV